MANYNPGRKVVVKNGKGETLYRGVVVKQDKKAGKVSVNIKEAYGDQKVVGKSVLFDEGNISIQ